MVIDHSKMLDSYCDVSVCALVACGKVRCYQFVIRIG